MNTVLLVVGMLSVHVNHVREILAAAVTALFLAPAELPALPLLQFDSSLDADAGLSRPGAVTFTPQDQTVCVTDEASRCLQVFDARGFHRFRTSGVANMSSPRDGCIDAAGGFVYTDAAGSRERTIRRLNFLGEPRTYAPEPPRDGWSPGHLVIARDGGYLTLDRSGLLAKHDPATGGLVWKLQVMDPEAEFVDLLGRPAEAPDGRIYVPDSGGRAVFAVSRDGRFLEAFGEAGTKRGTFAFPVGVAFGENRVLVLDRMRHKVLVFDAAHEFVTEFGRLGYAAGELYHPVAITAASDGRVWIAQGFKGRVQMFRLRDSESIPGASNRPDPVHNNEGEKQ